jgi:outer membrane protein
VLKTYLLIINLLLVAGVAVYVTVTREKKAYILNQQVFNEFKGKQELELQLSALQKTHKAWLDSVSARIQNGDNALINVYQENAANFQLEENELSEKYTADIWQKINEYIAAYGKEKGYDFIFGASGNGSLMYASDANNVTKEVITYVNSRYEEGD